MKQHLKNAVEKPEDWAQSPHIEGAIKNGTFTACRIIAEGHIVEPDAVTCRACQAVMAEHFTLTLQLLEKQNAI